MPKDFAKLAITSHIKSLHQMKFDLRETWERDI